MGRHQKLGFVAVGVAAGLVARSVLRRRSEMDLFGKVVLITGGSRGLGLAMAREFAAAGCKVALCARDAAELERARQDLESRGAQVYAARCDVTNLAEVDGLIGAVLARFGGIDILINNAGQIQVGPVREMTLADFEQAMDVMFWGVVYPTRSVLPHMLERRAGRIVNITSIGGKVAVPHLLPYDCAKFAAVGFSEGLRAELIGEGIKVVTIAPGLLRTGSYLNASFKGDAESESAWFGVGSSLPGITMEGSRAARQILNAARRGDAERILTRPAQMLARFHGMFPGATTEILGLINRLLPAGTNGKTSTRGAESHTLRSPLLSALTILGRMAARRYLQP